MFLFTNCHRISPNMWRSSQPGRTQIARMACCGVRTIINLRSRNDRDVYEREEHICLEHGLKLISFPVDSREPPKPEVLEKIESLFKTIAYPALMHCKAGSDRAGLMSVLYLHLVENMPMEKALGQLSLRYGHLRSAKTGVLDVFFETYIRHNAKNPTPFMVWAQKYYDRNAIITAHKSYALSEKISFCLLGQT